MHVAYISVVSEMILFFCVHC